MNSFPTSANYDFWIKNNLNVLLSGKRGIGKTESVLEKFREHFQDRWMYISAPTMDPWVDLVGVPKEVKDDVTGKSYLELIRPKQIENDEVEAIMIDEYNRAPAKVRNAIMELIQFKSINGKKFNNLKIVWAAINPYSDDNEYDVERLDPAQEDRFQVHVHLPYMVNEEFFIKKYGPLGRTACEWWKRLDDDSKNIVSPRRLEYAINVYQMGGELTYVLPYKINSTELARELDGGSSVERLKNLFMMKNDEETKIAFNNDNFVHSIENELMKNETYCKYFIPFINKDKLVSMYYESAQFRTFMATNFDYNNYSEIFDPICKNNDNNVKYSILASIDRWKKKYISNVSDGDFITIVSDFRHNYQYITSESKRDEVIERFLNITERNPDFDEIKYESMIGVCLEYIHQITMATDGNTVVNMTTLNKVLNIIKRCKSIIENKYNKTFIFNDEMAGLRFLKSDKDLYSRVMDILKGLKVI